jgi:hypothetical protein
MAHEDTTITSTMSSIYTDGPVWREIQEQQGWDDFLAWCREQENSPHE